MCGVHVVCMSFFFDFLFIHVTLNFNSDEHLWLTTAAESCSSTIYLCEILIEATNALELQILQLQQ